MVSKRYFEGIRTFLHGRFNLHEDSATEEEVHERIESGVIIRGTNLWVLIFATFIASIGLNLNSTAVIIGAMLISPLMGPIMGVGLALGTNDFELLKRASKNFGFMVTIAILTSTCYFIISPWSGAQSELLSRTTSTMWDVLIALFGGLAGIVAQTRKERSVTVIPGVAIATALMPPLCTAGYGLATMQLNYFFGAFYLFFINTVFIAIATFIVTNSLKYHKKQFIDPVREKKVKRMMAILIFLTIVPSVIIGYNLIREMIFQQNVNSFISKSFEFKDTRVVDFTVDYSSRSKKPSTVEVVLYGKPLSDDVIEMIKAQMINYEISNTSLAVKQAEDNSNLASSFIQLNFEQLLKEKNNKISELNIEVEKYRDEQLPASVLSKEMSAILQMDVNVAISRSNIYNNKGEVIESMVLCYIKYYASELNDIDKTKIAEWLKIRTGVSNIKIIDEHMDRPLQLIETTQTTMPLQIENDATIVGK